MYFDCGYLSYFGYNNTSLICGGYRMLMINNIRTIGNKVNYERFIKPIAFLHHFLNEMACFYIEPKSSDYKMLNVLINDIKRCPIYVRQLFEAFINKQKKIKINMRILNKYYAKLLNALFVTKECAQLIALSFVSLKVFKHCNIIEIEMEASMDGDVEHLSQLFIDTLLAEMETMNNATNQSQVREVRIYQIEIEEKRMLSFNNKLNEIQWNTQIVQNAKNKENRNYFGSSILMQKQ